MSEFYCGPCKIQLNSKLQWDQHLIGGKHMRIAALTQSVPVDKSAAIIMPDGNYKCKSCKDFPGCGPIPFEQHLIGQKHMKNVQRFSESPVCAPSSSFGSPPDTEAVMSLAVLQPDGSFKCKVCIDFACNGIIPMHDHLKGKSHAKNLFRNSMVHQVSVEHPTIATPSRKLSPTSSSFTVEERIAKAWSHQTICGYSCDEFFPKLSVEKKIEELSPHFAFIGKDDPMPNFMKYLSM